VLLFGSTTEQGDPRKGRSDEQRPTGFLEGIARCGDLRDARPATHAFSSGAALDGVLQQTRGDSQRMPTGLTLLHIRQGDRLALAVKTARGTLDVTQAASFFKTAAPLRRDLIGKATGDLRNWSATRWQKVRAALRGRGNRPVRAVHYEPAEILCVGLNYARHARETNTDSSTLPILFNKFNNA